MIHSNTKCIYPYQIISTTTTTAE